MDPRKKIWRGDPGQKYKLRIKKPENQDSFAPFVFEDACTLDTKQNYPGTLIRFPLRNEPSELSDKLYTTAKLKSILKALKDDASILLLFLRYIEKIEVFTINASGFVTKLFSVATDKATEKVRKSKKDAFFKQVKQFHSFPGTSLPFVQYEVTISVHDTELITHDNHQWIVANWVGSEDEDIFEASQRVCSLPWLGLAASPTALCPSRLSCFLPMPDSEEVNPPLPVCVHGTFGLTKDRRHLKWKTSDMQNDNGALWNDLLLSEMFPSCYAKFLHVLRDKCDPNMFYSFWPNVHFVNQTNWRVMLRPLLSLLLQDQLFWSQNGSWVKLETSVCVAPQLNIDQFPQVVISALIRCGKVVVSLDDRVWQAVQFLHTVAYPFTTINPSLVRQTLKNNAASYTNITRDDKFELLHYCLEDGNYYDLAGLLLLPVVDNTFVAFPNNFSKNKFYVCSEAFLETRLLANKESVLVNIENEDSSLHQKLIQIARSNNIRLHVFNSEAFAMILRQLRPFQNGWCCCGDAGGFYNENWLNRFWSWVSTYQLSDFVGIPLLPVCNEKTSGGFKVVALQNKHQSCVIKYNETVNFYPELINAAGKLGCYLTCSEEFKFLYHYELTNYVHELTQSSLLTISSQMRYQHVLFTHDEATALRHFLFQYPIRLNSTQKSVALNLQIFSTLQHNNLCSLNNAKCRIAGKSGAMILLDPDNLRRYTPYVPSNPLILTCTESTIGRLSSVLPGSSWFPTKLQIILHVIIPAIENNKLSKESILKVTSTILEYNEFYNLITGLEGSQLISRLRSLKFIPVSGKNALCIPSEVYDPKDHDIQELLGGENAFPAHPFLEGHFTALRDLGMKTVSILEASDIIRVAQIICNHQANSKARMQKAYSLIKFLCTDKGNTLLNTYYKGVPLEQTLRSMQWLPVMVNPPKGYPKCLPWKGATGSQFVSAQQIHASSSADDYKILPYLIGSQIKVLQYEGSISSRLMASFNISQNIPLHAVIQQFLNLVSLKKDIDKDKFNRCMKLLYDHLQIAVTNDPFCKEWRTLSQSEIVQVSKNKFILPSLVACSFDENSRAVGKLEPYLYILPDQLQQYRSLFCHIGVKSHVTVDDVFSVLKKIASKPSYDDWGLVCKILKWLANNFANDELQQHHDKIFIPIQSEAENELVLKPAKEVAFLDDDLQWLRTNKEELHSITEDYFLVHSSVSYDMACKLQLKPLNTMIANIEEFHFEQAGQSESLTNRLNRILREYKDTSVIQELLQNADDAGATEVAVYYDTREHDSSSLFFPGMANTYGPALLFYNNAEFTEEDFENITKIAGETKMNKPLKIGKFGVGFCSVYHITDVPSFVSGENFIVFDPTLQCLKKEIKSESNPGIKINFHKHRLLNKSKQLIPYTGIKGFDSKKQFKGTLFRFPLRNKSGKISDNVYTHAKVQLMFDRVKENSSKLLMFLNSVQKISFYLTDGDSFTKDFEVTVIKQPVNKLSGNALCKVSVSTKAQTGNCKMEEFLIACNSQKLQLDDNKTKNGTASVSIKLQTDDKSNKTCIKTVRGECFCFLPLHIETGLPIHVSSNFAVMTNRRGIWKADNISNATNESNWNRMLMESVVFQAYIALLLQLQKMQQKGLLLDYSFHCLWPLDLMETNPWDHLRNKFYSSILSSQHALFYSEITSSWKKLNECRFLSTKILASSFIGDLQSSLYHVAVVLKLPVVNLPEEIQNMIAVNYNFANQVINEEQFVKYFYNDKTLSKVSWDDKSAIVAASLMVYANQKHCSIMPELIKNTKCIPCSPDGQSFKKPQDIVDNNSTLAKLFSPEDGMFPHENFLKKSSLLVESLRQLGLMKFLSWTLLIDRAKFVPNWYEVNSEEALNRLTVLIDCIKDNCNKKLDKSIERKLQNLVFLPVMKKPDNYPINWKGKANFLTGPELTAVFKGKDKVSAIYACGSQVPILDTQFMSHPTYHFTPKVLSVLGIKQEIQVVHVVNQFNELLQHFQSISPATSREALATTISKETLEFVDNITITVYEYLSIKLKTSNTPLDLSTIKDKGCIWNGVKYLIPSNVSFEWKMDGPYLYKFPDKLAEYKSLMMYLGVQEEFSSEVLVKAIHDMKIEYEDNSLPPECQDVFRLITPKLENASIDAEIFLPDENFVLRRIKELKYNDAPWVAPEKEYLYCHECVGRKTAVVHLGMEPVKSALLEALDDSDKLGEEFGQEEKLTVRLNNILRDYPRDITFLKEILQNADDAGATKLFVMLDRRYHENEKVISEEWKHLQGPALLFWNDSIFTEEDLIGIQKIGLGNKREDADKIGQYGIGFNVVYHYTDCPSFITNDRLCILDPHRRYVARERMKPGKMYKDLEKLWHMFPHMKSSFLQNDFNNFPVDIKHGSLFRLPLRLTKEDAERSEIVQNDSHFELNLLEKEFKAWILSMQEALLFVHNVCEVRFFVINKPSPSGLVKWEEPNPIVLCSHVESVKGPKNVIMESGNTKLVMYHIRLTNRKTDDEEKWIVQLGEGNPINDSFDWNSIKPADMEVRPRHGIAACLTKITPADTQLFTQHGMATSLGKKIYRGKPFCFLPLPSYTYLPVHIHGQFALHSDRRCLWISSSDNVTSKPTKVDYKNLWNEYLIKAIGISYSYFLMHIVMQEGPISTKKESLKYLKDYYNLFPNFSEKLNEPWKTLASEVYKGLSELNPQILATLDKANHLDLKESKDDANQMHSITWHNLHMPQALNEGYFHGFHNFHSDICLVLKYIGMNLVDTPIFIHKQFKEAGIDLPIISKESVLQYYIRFQDNIYNHNKLPCDVSSTRFGKVEYFISFVKYLFIHTQTAKSDGEQKDTNALETKVTDALEAKDTNALEAKDANALEAKDTTTNTKEDDNATFSCGFLITADEFIHALSDGRSIINSTNWHLFPKSKNVFLHKSMITEFLGCSRLFQVGKSGEEYTLIHSVFANNLPSSWNGVAQAALEDIDISWVQKLLKCIHEDPIFKHYQQKLLIDFTLIPSDSNMMFSSSSEVLPMKTNPYLYKNIEAVLKKLKVFFLNNDVVGSILNDLKIALPSITVPNDVLKTLYLINKDHNNNLNSLTDEELTTLFKTFASISYASDLENENLSIFYIQQLPIFTTIYGERTSLSLASKVWIWNDQVCKVGMAEWICHVKKTTVIFLDPEAPWALLKSQADNLNIQKISLYELYCDYIFPHFSAMNSTMRIEHIKFISTKVFGYCKHESESTYSFNKQSALKFVKHFKILQCIGDDALGLQRIGSFYDHTQEIFRVFCDEQDFLPEELQDDDILDSLKFFGLRSIPTTSEFLNYCYKVSNFTEVSAVTKASQILLHFLFQNEDQYQHIYDVSFLKQVSDIPIAIIQTFPELNAIAKQCLSDCQVTENSGTVELTKLHGSCIDEYKHSTWTSKPLVNLPRYFYYMSSTKARANALGISLVPSIVDVVKNLINLANTEFADFSRFHQHGSQKSAEISCKLPEVLVHMLDCINSIIAEAEEHDAIVTYLRSQLEDLNFLPVKLLVDAYALVKPAQVLVMESSSLLLYYPFLHPLDENLRPMIQLLSQIGVKMSLSFSHIQLFFKLAKDMCKDEKVDVNIKRAAAKATEDLIVLLRQAKSTGNNTDIHLQPLYLLNEQDILTECSKLVVYDTSGGRLPLPGELTYLNPLTNLSTSIHWSTEELISLLPQSVGLKSLKSIMLYEILSSAPVSNTYVCVSTIEQILRSSVFKTAIERYACYCMHSRQPPQRVTEILTEFQTNLQVEYLADVLVKPQLILNDDVISLNTTISEEFFLQCSDGRYILSLKNTPTCYPQKVFTRMSKHLCLALQLQETRCFDHPESDEVPELTSFVCELLNCGSVFKLTDVIIEQLPGCDDIEQDLEPSNPVLGEIIPDCWHHRLDQNVRNYFMPTEWVGYENKDGRVVYAQILHINDVTASSEENLQQFLQQEYTITTGSDTPLITTIWKLFKFIYYLKEPEEQLSILEEGVSADVSMHSYQATDEEVIRKAVKAAWSLPEEERKRAIKRLYLQYHPDKNPDNPYATANFQLLQQEIARMERMERGVSEENFDTNQDLRNTGSAGFSRSGFSRSDFSSSGWSGWFHQWDRTASSHRRYRSRDRARGSTSCGMPSSWNIPKPKKENSEAKRWIKQAEYDHAALSGLEALSQTDDKVCAATCFMSHEVAEKALKAGMYAECGMNDTILKSHSLESPARALLQVGCLADINDAVLLENFYSQPRFPYCYPHPVVPGEKYLKSTASEAFHAASRIYEAMKQLIEDDW